MSQFNYYDIMHSCFVDVDIISKFAQLEFKDGEPERGKTMFESLLSSYPRRIDLWSVYIDMMIKLGESKPVRYVVGFLKLFGVTGFHWGGVSCLEWLYNIHVV